MPRRTPERSGCFVDIHNACHRRAQFVTRYLRAMANYVLVYKGGAMGATPEEQQKAMAAWGQWFGSLGQSLVDGGAPFSGQANSIGSDGSVKSGAPSGLTGYSIVKADDLAAATAMAKGCPVLSSGGTLEVLETHQVM
jgi:hypothetical protein